jgi:hypothetical protein
VTAGEALFRRPTVAASEERPYARESTTLSPAEPVVEPSGCPKCYGTGMEIVPGRGPAGARAATGIPSRSYTG